MLKKISVVTGNTAKVQQVRQHLSPLGIETVQVNLALVEPQADSIETVALSKAAQAFVQLHEPLLVEDSGFYIDDLKGFPGPYTHYVLDTIGIGGLLRLAEPLASRSCRFLSVLAFVDAEGKSRTFVDTAEAGDLSREIDTTPSDGAWSELWRIFILDGHDRPLSAFTGDELAALWEQWETHSVYKQFAEWLEENRDH
jgi:XTP/dITP diphosphohydrolase